MLERLGHHKAKSFSDIEVGTTVEMSLLLVSATCALTKRNTKYYTLLLRDETEREMQAKVWDEATLPPNMKCASVYDIVANVGVYNGNKQLSVTLMGESELSPSMFAIKPPIKYDDEQLWKELVDIVSSFTEPVAKFLGEELLTDDNLVNEIKTAPAAKSIHNNWVGGLLEHAVALCRLATSSIEQYKRYYPQLSRDKILLGCLIHDLGKIHEFKLNQGNIEYTPFGYLIGHITWGPVWVSKKIDKFIKSRPMDDTIGRGVENDQFEIIHIIASHHGKLEYGSPVVPSTIEAIIVHGLDMLDTHAMHAIKKIEKEGDVPGFSERSYPYNTCFKLGGKPS